MKLEQMSRRSKEEYAAALLKFSYSLSLAFFITLTIAPLGMIISNVAQGRSAEAGWLAIASATVSVQGLIFIILELAVISLSDHTRKRAFDIYNDLYPDSGGNGDLLRSASFTFNDKS